MSAYLEHQSSLFKCFMKPWTRHTRGQIYVRTSYIHLIAKTGTFGEHCYAARTVSVSPCWYVHGDYKCAVVQFYHVIYLNACTPMVSTMPHAWW